MDTMLPPVETYTDRLSDREPDSILKRDGSLMPFDRYKIREAMRKATLAVPSETMTDAELDRLTAQVVGHLDPDRTPGVEQVQDIVEEVLMKSGRTRTAKAYILYRADHSRIRSASDDLMQLFKEITFSRANDADSKRENANINADSAMGAMLKYGSESSKHFIDTRILPAEFAQAHAEGFIHIHDKDFYMLTETCCQIDLEKLFSKGFSTGHGALRPPQSIGSYAALACIAIQANQNEMHGGQSIPDFDFVMAPGVNRSYRKALIRSLKMALSLLTDDSVDAKSVLAQAEEALHPGNTVHLDERDDVIRAVADALSVDDAMKVAERVEARAYEETVKETAQAMQALIHNLNTMNSRAGAQVPFSSINYGTDTSVAGRLVTREVLKATQSGLGNGETPIFPVQIFKVKEGVNAFEDDPNYDLYRLAMETTAQRLFPNFSFLDAPFNKEFYKEGDRRTEVAYMGCRTRVMGNVHDPDRAITHGRGNLSFTSINLPRLAIEARGDVDAFLASVDRTMDLVFRQLLHRFAIQSRKSLRNHPFLMGEGIWIDSDTLGPDDHVGEVLKHGSLSVGFIGLAEALTALTGAHHGESTESEELGKTIVSHMRERCDAKAEATGLNFTLLATPAEGLSGRFVRIDRKRYGSMEGITDREYYTNSFHIPVHFPITAHEKIRLEAPYHALTNAGHITYVELDGDAAQNVEALERVLSTMRDAGIGYGSVNHPVDRDPVCGFTGVINDECPRCGRKETADQPFQRIRRITGYLVGTTERFNDAKQAEERDRVRHAVRK